MFKTPSMQDGRFVGPISRNMF